MNASTHVTHTLADIARDCMQDKCGFAMRLIEWCYAPIALGWTPPHNLDGFDEWQTARPTSRRTADPRVLSSFLLRLARDIERHAQGGTSGSAGNRCDACHAADIERFGGESWRARRGTSSASERYGFDDDMAKARAQQLSVLAHNL